jgi:hypothetical protein
MERRLVPRRARTTKKLAQRIDLQYFTRPHPFRRWRFLLSVGLPALAVAWLAWHALHRDNRVFSSGQMSAAHAVLASQCNACHVSHARVFRELATDQACLSCHDGPIHHANQLFTPSCASCHVEHRGPVRLAAVSEASCTQCHANLQAKGGAPAFERKIESFPRHHPEFAALRPGGGDPSKIKLNHAVHLKANLRGPNGPVQLDCADCHRTPAADQTWPYGDPQWRAAPSATTADPFAPTPTRAYMAPVGYAKSCAACHLLQFDEHFAEGVPHDRPGVVHAFLMQRFAEYIARHPAELRLVREPDRNLAGKPIPASVRLLTPPQWVVERVAEAEQLLWRKTCRECHSLNLPAGAVLPEVARSNIPVRWMPHAVFDHEKHRMMVCTSCHARTPTSQETSDVLVPGIQTCQQCHHPGAQAAEARCFECHAYHDWNKQKPVKGRYKLSELFRGTGATVSQATRLAGE